MEKQPSGLVAFRYSRVSDDKRKLSRSVPEQEAEGLEAIAACDWVDGGSFSDPDMSASRFATKARPQWATLVDDVLPSGKVGVLVLWEPARGSRVLSTWALLLETCQRLGILVHITSHEQTYNLRNPRHWKTLADDGVKAVYDSEETSMRVLRGVAGHALTGKPYGQVLYGYRRHYHPETKDFLEQVIDEERAGVVRDCANWIAAKKSLGSLIEHLHERGFRSPSGNERWSYTSLKQMVLNPGYVGKRVHQGKAIGDGVWPAILTEQLQRECRDVLKAEGRSKERDGAVVHVLSGIVTCESCGGALRVDRGRSGHLYYQCKSRHVGIRKAVLEEYVQEIMLARLDREDFADLLTSDQTDDARAAEEETARLRATLEEFYEQAAPTVPEEDRLSALGLARAERQYLPLIEAAESRAKQLRVPAVLRAVRGPGIRARWPLMEMSQQREVLRSVMTLQVLPLGRGRKAPPEDRVVIDWRQS